MRCVKRVHIRKSSQWMGVSRSTLWVLRNKNFGTSSTRVHMSDELHAHTHTQRGIAIKRGLQCVENVTEMAVEGCPCCLENHTIALLPACKGCIQPTYRHPICELDTSLKVLNLAWRGARCVLTSPSKHPILGGAAMSIVSTCCNVALLIAVGAVG